jgi:pilus assembly protein CpaB
MLMVLSALAAVLVFVGVSTYVASVNSKVGPMVTTYQMTKDVPAFTTLSAENTEPVQVPQRWTADNTVLKSADIDGRVTATPMAAGATISSDSLVPPSDLNPDEREVAVNVDAVTGLAGRVRPGDRVDMYAVFTDVPGLPKEVVLLVENVRVISVAGQLQVQTPDAKSLQNVIPVTLALTSDEALSVTYASQIAAQVRLVGLPPGVAQDRSKEKKTFDARSLGGKAIPEQAR